jgi:penicillin G amidase
MEPTHHSNREQRVLKSYPLMSRFLAFVLFPVLAAMTGVTWYAFRSLPDIEGERVVAGISGPVSIARDVNGVVYIDARSDRDAFFALGFAHAQDRLWQLEIQRRIARGRLSEVFGRATIAQDAWIRTLDLYGSARSSWAALSVPAQASLTAYAQGINAWLDAVPVLPAEFLALGVRPERWTELDSLAWTKVFALNLSDNMRTEIANLIASQSLDAAQLTELVRLNPEDLARTASRLRPELGLFADRLAASEQQWENVWKVGGAYVGSNAWVIAGRHTASGAPILANDTHLGLQIPSLWYVAALHGDRLDVAGMTLVGLPIVVLGRNPDIAWGATAMTADVQDLYVEQPNPTNPKLYRAADGWRTFETRIERIEVKADFPAALRSPPKPVDVLVRKTVNGPIVSDAFGALDQPVALRWTALENDASYEALYRLNYARDWETFKQALAFFTAPALNLLYSDSRGNIGMIGAGRIPVRAQGSGRLPVPGWTQEYRWTGYIPFERLPQRYNPPEGYIVSANDGWVAADYPFFISADWAPPDRARRIKQLLSEPLESGKRLSIDHVARMQADTVDLGALKLARVLARAPLTHPEHREALKYLAQWSGDMSRDSPSAGIFFTWTRHLREELFAARLRGYWNKARQHDELLTLAARTTHEQILDALNGSPAQWCDRDTSVGERSCHAVLERSLGLAIQDLTKLQGSDMSAWRWGAVHETLYEHLPFSRIEPVGKLFERRIENGGAPNTINVASGRYRRSVGYEQTFGAGFRQIVAMQQSGPTHLYMGSTGQSGNVLSPHYDDMLRPFRDVRFHRLEQRVPQSDRSTLVLRPR